MNKSQSEFMLYTVATFSPGEVNLLAQKYGFRWPEDSDEARTAFLKHLWDIKGEKGLHDIASIHPDRDLIIAADQLNNSSNTNNADGTATGALVTQTIIPPVVMPSTSKGMTEGERLLIFILFMGVILAIIFKK